MIGFDIGGTKCAVCFGHETGNGIVITDKRVIATDHSISAYEMLDKMYALAQEMTEHIDVIGISCGGPLDSKAGVIQSPPNLPGWDNIPIVAYLKEKYGATAYLANDANACALAEWQFGAGQGCNNMIFLTFGTGMGAGLILNGQLYTGTNDMAGEIGHIRMADFGPVGYGKQGSFEGFCSGSGIAQLGRSIAKERLQQGQSVSFCPSMADLPSVSAKSIAQCASAGNADALEVYDICGQMLGRGLSILIDLLNPERIVIGSIYQRSHHLLQEKMQKQIYREALERSHRVCAIVPAALEEDLGNYAALAVALTGGRENAV